MSRRSSMVRIYGAIGSYTMADTMVFDALDDSVKAAMLRLGAGGYLGESEEDDDYLDCWCQDSPYTDEDDCKDSAKRDLVDEIAKASTIIERRMAALFKALPGLAGSVEWEGLKAAIADLEELT